jgi:hypothetical protein
MMMMSLVGQLVGRYWKGNLLVGRECQPVDGLAGDLFGGSTCW